MEFRIPSFFLQKGGSNKNRRTTLTDCRGELGQKGELGELKTGIEHSTKLGKSLKLKLCLRIRRVTSFIYECEIDKNTCTDLVDVMVS